nr:hypothetical protein [Tanacetum cinerariifolium]
MDMTIDQQVALDEAIVPHASRLRIGKSNFRLKSDISSKESTLQLAYDVLRLTPFYKAFLITADVPEIYMQEFWETTTVHHHSIRFKMDNKKHIVNLEYFNEMLHICPRLRGQTFDELPFEEEIMAFLRFLRYSGEIRKLNDVEHKDAKKSNKMYYPRFTKVIVHYFMSKDPSIPRRNRVNWHYVKDDQMFTTIKLVSRHQNTQQFGAMLHIELTNAYIKNSEAYKEYYAVATGATPPKTKVSFRKTKSSSDTTVTPLPTAAAGTRLSTSAKGKQLAKASKAKNKETGIIPGVPNVPTEESDEEISWKSSDEEDDDDIDEGSDDQDDDDAQDDDDDQDDENKDDDDQDESNNDDQDSDEEDEEFIYPKLSIHDEEETKYEESFDPIAKTPENTNNEGNDKEYIGLNVRMEEGQDEQDNEDEIYRDVNINLEGRVSSSVSSQFVTSMLNPTPDAGIDSNFKPTSQMDVRTTTTVAPLPLSAPTITPLTIATISTTLEANFSEFMQTNQFVGAVSSILGIVQRYMDQRMNEAVKTMNEQLEAKVLTRSSNSSYVVVADLSEMELKKILIEKMEGNKSIHRYNEQRNLYKALVEAYESDKIILETYRDTVTLKRRRDNDADKDEEPFAGSDRGSKRRREGKEVESTSAPKEKATRTTGKSTQGSKSRQTSASESAIAKEPMKTTHDLEEPSHPEFETSGPTYELMKGSCKSLVELEFFLEEVYKATTDQLDWINPEGQQYPHNLLKPLPLIPNSRGRRVIPFDHFINNDLVYLREGASSRKYTTSVTKTKAADYGHIKWIEDLNLDWITVRRDDDKLYKFKEGDFKRLRIQDIEDMLLLLVQGKLTNLTVEERFAFNVSLRMFTRSIVIQRRVENLQLGVESYQKKLNLTRPDTYHSDLKRKEAYTAYSNLRGFIYLNKDKQNRLMRIDELQKFSDGTLTDVRTALDDRLKGIWMKYLPQTIWRKSDKERAAAMIHAIDKQLKTRRIMRRLERSSYARVMVELRADVELIDDIVVAMLKITMEDHYTCKPNASSSGNKKKGVETTIEVSNSNPFVVLNSVDNDEEFGTNRETTNMVNNEATSSGSFFMNMDNVKEFASNTHIVPTSIMKSNSEVEVVFDETTNLRISTSGKDGSDKGYGTNSLLEQWRDSYLDNDDYDPYDDDDMYENHDLSEHLQSICDDLDIMVRGRKKK